jgi:hypothetical protein
VEKFSSLSNIEIFYEKNPLYRTIYSDGLIGGRTPTNTIYLAFYATRNPLPKSMRHEINVDSTLNPTGIPSEDSKTGIMREIEVGVYMSEASAKDVYEFLKKIFDKDAN